MDDDDRSIDDLPMVLQLAETDDVLRVLAARFDYTVISLMKRTPEGHNFTSITHTGERLVCLGLAHEIADKILTHYTESNEIMEDDTYNPPS